MSPLWGSTELSNVFYKNDAPLELKGRTAFLYSSPPRRDEILVAPHAFCIRVQRSEILVDLMYFVLEPQRGDILVEPAE